MFAMLTINSELLSYKLLQIFLSEGTRFFLEIIQSAAILLWIMYLFTYENKSQQQKGKK